MARSRGSPSPPGAPGARPDHTALNVAVLRLDFDPRLTLETVVIQLQAVALAGVVILGLLLWAERLRVVGGTRGGEDFLYVTLGIIPGAVAGGRILHALAFAPAYALEPMAIFDLSRGSLSLVGAVIGGTLSGAYVARLAGHPPARWADTAALPMLLSLGLGKLAMLLGGAGQGTPSDLPWAVAFTGPGPWLSSDPAIPSHPAQAYEGLWALGGIAATRVLGRRWAAISGATFLLALGWWLAGRSATSLVWPDEPVFGPLGGEQAITLVMLAGVAIAVGVMARMPRRVRTKGPPSGLRPADHGWQDVT